jgi:two-component system cell cycle response regulator
MPAQHGVCLLGFSDFERHALTAHFRLAIKRSPSYTLVAQMEAAQYLVVDADAAGWAGRVERSGRSADTVFVGTKAPADALVRLPRPIDALHVLRELDAAVLMRAARLGSAVAAAGPVAQGAEARRVPQTAPAEASASAPRDPPPDAAGSAAASQLSDLAALFPDRLDAQPQAERESAFDALLVDDSDVALRILAAQLADLGVRARCVSDSDAALAHLARHAYPIVFVDVELGDKSRLDGLRLCRHIKRSATRGAAPLVAMVSAHAAPTDRVRGSLAGCDAYLAKPLVPAELAAVIARHRDLAQVPQRRRRS